MEPISIRQARTAIPGLLDLIQYIEEQGYDFKDFKVAEIGSFVGDSTRVFAERCESIHCIDPWENGYDETDPSSYNWPMEQIENQFDELAEELSNIHKWKMNSEAGSKEFEDGFFDFVYIDGNHLYEFVKLDMECWLPKVKKGMFIGGHDYQHKRAPGVKPAVLEAIGSIDKHFQDTSWIKQL